MKGVRASGRASGWRRTVIGGYVLILVLLTAVWAFSIAGPISNAIEQHQERNLASVAQAAGVALEATEQPASDVLASIAQSDDLRLTLIGSDGTVLAESTDDQDEMKNHGSRPEVAAALAGTTGSDLRVSETDGHEYLYVAVPGIYRGDSVAIRVSMPAEQLHELLGRLRWTVIALMAAAVILAVGIAWGSFARARTPVRRLERVRTDFMANASHELKTPVAGIRLLAESIEQAAEDGDDASVTLLAKRLDAESRRLQSLVGDLMDLSRLEDENRQQTVRSGCDLAGVVSLACETHLPLAQQAGLELLLDEEPPANLGCHVNLSATDATLVVDNLLDNALAYTEEGAIKVHLAIKGSDAILAVSDTGIGIPTFEQERIFERFYRVDTARSREAGGTGLGLSLVLHAVHRGGGTIGVESELGKGSTFTVRLPLAS